MNVHLPQIAEQDVPAFPELDAQHQHRLWESFSKAVGAELRERPMIRGASGLDHPAQAIAVDDKNRRIIIVSAEQNARVAAMMQGDVQATMRDVRVLVARPVVVDLGVMARSLFRTVEGARINLNEFKATMDRFNKLDPARSQRYFNRQFAQALKPAVLAFKHVALPTLNQIVDVIEQMAHLDWSQIFNTLKTSPDNPSISFENLMKIDNMAIDRKHGVCPIPLYEFSEPIGNCFSAATILRSYSSAFVSLISINTFSPQRITWRLVLLTEGCLRAPISFPLFNPRAN
jgi:hypothetical protein